MALLTVEIKKEDQITALKKLLEIYFIIQDMQYCPADITLLAYYCLLGTNKEAGKRMIKEFYPKNRTAKTNNHAVEMIRTKLTKLKVLVRDPYTLKLSVAPYLLKISSEPHKYGAMLKFSYINPLENELETNSTNVSKGI